MTSAAPEPTDEQRKAGEQFVWEFIYTDYSPERTAEGVARALAAAVTAEREKYLLVAEWLDAAANDDVATRNTVGDGYNDMAVARVDAARRIREVSR